MVTEPLFSGDLTFLKDGFDATVGTVGKAKCKCTQLIVCKIFCTPHKL